MEDTSPSSPGTAEDPALHAMNSCKDLLVRLQDEKERLEREIKKEYRNARKYVRSHPEESVLYSFVGGFVLGIVLTRLMSR